MCACGFSVELVQATGVKRIEVDGKFFSCEGARVYLRSVTYGPFPEPQPDHGAELLRVRSAGFNAIRIYQSPSVALLDAAESAGIWVFVGLSWSWERVFLGANQIFEQAKRDAREDVMSWGGHPAVAGCYIANEVRPDLARWMGVEKVRLALEELIDWVKKSAPDLLVAYASYPSSEYLEPGNADFTAMNVYLERPEDYVSYLRRLHHLAGDRPVVISEFGVDSLSHGEMEQSRILEWGARITQQEGLAGWTCFAWSDRWQNGGRSVQDWAFGLINNEGVAKPALELVGRDWKPDFLQPKISVIICVYNGVDRIGHALESLREVNYPDYEVIVVDDGSTDGTLELVSEYSEVRLIASEHAGLSVARNVGAAAATGAILSYTDDDCTVDPDYLFWLAKAYAENDWGACGGPNIPPVAESEDEAVVASAPGAPSHVMFDDVEAEHIPGCHLSVRAEVFEAIGGFRAQYRVAGDDVDFCWKLRDAGYKIGFHGASFVWHRRRATLMGYFRQQWGYGKAEALLMHDHPDRFSRGGGARWEGCVYTGAAKGAGSGTVIYHGPSGLAGYQVFWDHMMPQRRVHPLFISARVSLKLTLANLVQPIVRMTARWKYGRKVARSLPRSLAEKSTIEKRERGFVLEVILPLREGDYRSVVLGQLASEGWLCTGDFEAWDLMKGDSLVLMVSELIGQNQWCVRVRFLAPLCDHHELEMTLLRGLDRV